MKKYKSLFFIFLLAVFLRFFQLGSNPPSLTWDEVALGYNAYSLGIDLRDEFGRFLPLDYLESFGDFKPPLYAYLDILPIKIFGLNEFAVRFPSALFGVLTVLITYFLVKRIFGSQEKLALVSSFLLAISPWHINLSRAAFEANVASFLIVCGVWLFLSFIQEKKFSYLALSIIAFCLSVYTFNTTRVVAPLLVMILGIGFIKVLFSQKKQMLFAALLGILVLLPTLKFLFSPQASLRFKEVNIFSDIGIVQRSNQEIANDNYTWWSKIIHNRRISYGIEYVRHYLDHLTPRFLFVSGDGNPKFSTQDIGQLYIWELPFLITGILLLFRKKEGYWWVIPLWFLFGILPAATARETPHALRIETTFPTFQIITAYGLVVLFNKISNIKYRNIIFSLFFLFFIFNFLYYFHGYYAHYPRQFSGEWQYGYKEAIAYLRSVENLYDKIYFTEALGRPYAYILFYTGYSPELFRKEAVVEREVYGFVHVRSFGKYHFIKNLNRMEKQGTKTLYFDGPEQVPKGASILRTFSLLNGNPTLVAYTL